MWEIFWKITAAFFAVYGFYSVLTDSKELLWQWYRYMTERKKKEKRNKFSDGIDNRDEK